MFTNTFPPKSKFAHAERKAAVDRDRDVWLQSYKGIAKEPGSVFILVWQDRVIPFDAHIFRRQDHLKKSEFYVYKISAFGQSPYSALPRYHFSSDDEREQALLLAAEALCVFGGFGDGDRFPEGTYRVELNEKVYSIADFHAETAPEPR